MSNLTCYIYFSNVDFSDNYAYFLTELCLFYFSKKTRKSYAPNSSEVRRYSGNIFNRRDVFICEPRAGLVKGLVMSACSYCS